MKNLYISHFSTTPSRQVELDTCLSKNTRVFDNIYILFEGDHYFHHIDKVKILPVNIRPTFRTFFSAVNQLSAEGDINVVANADIYFTCLNEPSFMECYALTRWEGDKFLDRADSQDSWVFKGAVRIPAYCDFWMGVRGCDNRINWELMRAGYNVTNPSLTIKTYHLHAEPTDHSKSLRVVNQPYLKLNPCEL